MKLITLKFCLSIALLCSFQFATAQLSLCNGNSGPAIFTEDFGTGLTNGPELAPGITNYPYNIGNPTDGEYTITSMLPLLANDHTPGDINGKTLFVNADLNPGIFYESTIPGLCINTTYEFSAWLMNLNLFNRMCGTATARPINVRFEILDANDGSILASGDTGDITGGLTLEWIQRGLVFKTTTDTVILKMINNGVGGCGNDLAIDDIVFNTCGDTFDIIDSNGITSNMFCEANIENNEVTLDANPDGVVFTTYAYQWQQSSDNIDWTDITGANNQTYTPNAGTGELYFRVITAEVAGNLNNNSCNVISDAYKIIINPNPDAPVYNGTDVEYCEDSAIAHFATVVVNAGETVDWYDANGISVDTDTTSYADQIIDPITGKPVVGSRTYYAETVNITTGCVSKTRTPVTFTIYALPDAPITTPSNNACEGSTVTETVTVNTGETVNWFAAATGGTPLLQGTNTTSYTDPDTSVGPRTFYAETVNQTTGCVSATRTPVAFTINTLPNAPIGVSPGLVCDELDYILNVNTPANTDIQINWYDTPNGGTPIQENSTTLNVTNSGTFYAEAININTGCISLGRTALSIDFSQTIILDGEFLSFCQGESITLSAAITGDDYLWSTGETTREINVSTDGVFDVSIISLNVCPTFQIFTVGELEDQTVNIENIRSENRNIIVQVSNPNDFEYSLDGYDFQESPVFRNLQGGRYKIYIQSVNGCTSLSLEYLHLVIPKFFTPNGDGINEMFVPEGFENVEQYSMNIFDRYGKLLANYTNINNGWNGMYNNQVLPSSDYWYAININGEEFKGHVTLKR